MSDGALLSRQNVLSNQFTDDPCRPLVDVAVVVLGKLTVWPFRSFRVESTCCLDTIVLLDLSRITANQLMLFGKSCGNTQLMKASFTSLVLLANPATFNKIAFAFLYASSVRVIKMRLSPQDLLVDVAARMRDHSSGQDNGCDGVRKLDHDAKTCIKGEAT